MSQKLPSCEVVGQAMCRLPLSPVALKIIEIANNEKAPVQSLADVIAADVLWAARLLAVVNFAAGLPQRLSTLSQAITVLGLDKLKSLALGLAAFPLKPSASAGGSESVSEAPITLRQLWEHSLGCAAVAGRIAVRINCTAPHDAFVGGFLHDVGKLFFYRDARESFFASVTVAADKSIPLSEAETLALGISHLDLGELWARRERLPLDLQQTIRYHHRPFWMLPDFIEDDRRRVIAIVQLADLLCEAKNVGKGGDAGIIPSELWRTLALCEEDCTDDLNAIRRDIEAAREVFGFLPNAAAARVPVHKAAEKRSLDSLDQEPQIAANLGRGQVIRFPSRSEEPGELEDIASLRKLKILVVEDHGSLCDMLSLYLMRYGYHVCTANNGKDALAVLETEEIHLVLLDLMLPRMDGFAALRQLGKKRYDDTPYIIVVSAGASEKDRSKVLELGADEYMPKPFHLMRLLERIQAVEKYLL